MKKALMIVAIVAIVAIVGSFIYYYIFFKPGIEKAEIRLQEQKLESEKSSQIKEYLNEYNAIRQEFIDKLNLYVGSKDKDKILTELQEIRRKLMILSVPEGYNKYKDVKSSCLTAMDECIVAIEEARLGDVVGAKVDDSKIKELADKLVKNWNILKSLSIND